MLYLLFVEILFKPEISRFLLTHLTRPPWLQDKMKELVFSIDTSRSEISDPPTLGPYIWLCFTCFNVICTCLLTSEYMELPCLLALTWGTFSGKFFVSRAKALLLWPSKAPRLNLWKTYFSFFFIFQFSVAIALSWSFHNISYINNMFFLFPFLRAFFFGFWGGDFDV